LGIRLADLPTVCCVFERFLGLPNNQQLANDIAVAIEDYENLRFTDIGRRIATLRNLTLTIEPSLKAIGRLRYAQDATQLKQLEEQNLRSLLEHGLVLPKMHWDENYTNKKHCSVYWSEQNCLAAVAYKVYLLRNKVSHETPSYSLEQISALFNTTLALLILAIHHPPNRAILELATSPYRSYLEWAAQLDPDYDRYVCLQADLRWQPSSIDAQPISLMQAESFSTVPLPKGPDEVSVLIKQVDKMVLTGEGGAGKSHTFRHVTALLAREILSLQAAPEPIPIYLPAELIGYENKLSTNLSRLLGGVQPDEIGKSLIEGQYWILIDGLNEVAPKCYREVLQELKAFLINFPKCRVVISTRQEVYYNELPLPVYELKSLTPYGVSQILRLNANTEEQGSQLFSNLKNDKRLLALFKTPLMSKLLCELPPEIRIPRSMGEMMSVLFNQIFEREESKGDQVRTLIKRMALVELAKTIRDESGTILSEEEILRIFENIIQRFAHEVSPNFLLTRLIESGILERRGDGFVAFFHETALDYFTALGLKDACEKKFDKNVEAQVLSATPSSIEILSGLLSSADTLTQFISQQDLRWAARCYSARSQRSKQLFRELFNAANSLLMANSIAEIGIAVQVMAALDEIEATQAVFMVLPKLPEEARTVASNALVQYAPNGITEEVRQALESGEFAQQLVAIKFTSAHQIVEFTPLVIKLAESQQSNLAHHIAKALGYLESAEALNYLEQQCNTPRESGSIPLAVAINVLSSERAVSVLKIALKDPDVEVRRAAISRIETINLGEIDTEVSGVVVSDLDFLVRLIGVQILLRRTENSHREQSLKDLFSTDPLPEESLPAARIMKVVSLLHQNELEDVALRALCTSHPAIQSLIINRILSRNLNLAFKIFPLVEFDDPAIDPGVKMALIKALISLGYHKVEMLQRAMSSSSPHGVRLAVVQMLANLPSDIATVVLEKALADPSEQVKVTALKSLASYPDLCSEQLVEQLLFYSNRAIERQAWNLVNTYSIFENKKLFDWTKKNWPTYLRTRAIEELNKRRFSWPLHKACALARDIDYGIRLKGEGILEAIFHSRQENIGKINNWVVKGGYGFLVRLGTKEQLFFHASNLIDKQYTPLRDDFVTFQVGEPNAGQTKPCAVQVCFLKG
jgi:HEAT repeat protein/cold shock CspA family protein